MSPNDLGTIPRTADVWLVIRKAAYWIHQHAQDSVAATHLGLTDFAVLKVLLFTGPLPINVIGSKVLLTSGSITATVDRLAAQGLVKRTNHPTDRRAYLVSLTPAGRKKIGPASLKHAKKMAEVVSVLTPAEQRELVRLMKKIGKHAMSAYSSKKRGKRSPQEEVVE
jgi:MarR family transcriptional regulator, 2-MHQ and catechol-resistance regulon repressor